MIITNSDKYNIDKIILQKEDLENFPRLTHEKLVTNPNAFEIEFDYDVKSIPPFLFSDTKIHNIKLPNSLKHIGFKSFFRSDIQEIDLPDSIETLGDYAFSICNHIKKVKLPNIRKIPLGVFSRCVELQEVEFAPKNEIIKPYAFFFTGLETVDFKNIISIGNSAFAHCEKLHAITLNKENFSILNLAFKDDYNLSIFAAPRVGKRICQDAFRNCKILDGELHLESIKNIESRAFDNVPAKIFVSDSTNFKKDAFSWNSCIVYKTSFHELSDDEKNEAVKKFSSFSELSFECLKLDDLILNSNSLSNLFDKIDDTNKSLNIQTR